MAYQIKLAEEALRMTITERKRTYKMLLNAQIISQMKDMTSMTNEFLAAIQVISKDITRGTTADVSKLSGELRLAMDRVAEQTEQLGEMLEDSQEEVTEFSTDTSLVSDDEINSLIYGTAAGATTGAGATTTGAGVTTVGAGATTTGAGATISRTMAAVPIAAAAIPHPQW